MTWHAVYDTTGRIVQVENRPVLTHVETPPPRPWLPFAAGEVELPDAPGGIGDIPAWCDANYVTAGAITARPLLPEWDVAAISADGIDAATLTGLPDGCDVRIGDGAWTAVQDNEVVFTADVADTYRVEVRGWPYVTRVQAIVAVEP